MSQRQKKLDLMSGKLGIMQIKNTFMKNIKFFKKTNKKKKLFIIYGFANVILTNIILQILLFFLSSIYATLISQIFNLSFGFYFYGKNVFRIKSLNFQQFIAYLFLNIFLWNFNWIMIDFISSYGLSKNISSITLICPLASISYLSQKFLIFKK